MNFILLVLLLIVILVILAFQVRKDIPVEQLKAKYGTSESQYLTVNGLEVHYRDEGSGYPLVLLHGAQSSLLTWDPWKKILQNHFRIIRLDLPGWGITGPSPERTYTMEAYTIFLKQFLDQLGVRECHLAGNSLGGWIGWQFASRYPEMVNKLVLLDAAGYIDPKKLPLPFKLARLKVLTPLLHHVTPRWVVAYFTKIVYADKTNLHAETITLYHELMLREGNRKAMVDFSRMPLELDTDRIPKISSPTLILWGALDKWIGKGHAHKFHRDLPNSEMIIYDKVGHVPMEEIPERSAADTLKFLTKS